MGTVSICDLLAGASGMGDEPQRVSSESGFSAGVAPETNWSVERLDCVRPAVGSDRSHQHCNSFFAALFSSVAAGSSTVPAISSESRSGPGHAGAGGHTVAGPQLCGIRKIHLYS